MTQWPDLLHQLSVARILPASFQHSDAYTFQLDSPSDFAGIDPTDIDAMIKRTDELYAEHNATWGIGQYAEQREIYTHEQYNNTRHIHLGIDLSVPNNTLLYAPLDGVIHSFADNPAPGDYGPTLILQHVAESITFYTLYGHLSTQSLQQYQEGKVIEQGDAFATVGTPNENGGWPPHLHFQIIHEINHHRGNYPGVCTPNEKNFYLQNCPNPTALLRLK